MKVPFTWKVTGWLMASWSPEFPIDEVRPLQYFGEDLVALARYKLPKAIVFRPVIERSPSGEADYRWAREQAVND